MMKDIIQLLKFGKMQQRKLVKAMEDNFDDLNPILYDG